MPKTIVSPVKTFPGTVILYDPLTWPQTIAFEEGFKESQSNTDSKRFYALIKAILPSVYEWHLENFPEEIKSAELFPMKPRAAVYDLIIWIAEEVFNIQLGEV